jgi:hypothetical protein
MLHLYDKKKGETFLTTEQQGVGRRQPAFRSSLAPLRWRVNWVVVPRRMVLQDVILSNDETRSAADRRQRITDFC